MVRRRRGAQDTGSRDAQNPDMRQPLACILLIAVSLLRPAVAQQPPASLATLSWLAGCWQSELDEPGSGEQWMAPAGGVMLGMARTLKGGRVVQFEFMQLRESATGLAFIAHPGGRPGSSFRAVEATADAAVFERDSADFPQRVVYRRRADGGLAARIEGDAGGQKRGVDFPMRRAACAGG
jgi:hypothetical protein